MRCKLGLFCLAGVLTCLSPVAVPLHAAAEDFVLKDSVDTEVFRISQSGDAVFRKSTGHFLENQATISATSAPEVLVKNAQDQIVALFDSSTGEMKIKGTVQNEQASIELPSSEVIVLARQDDQVLCLVDELGNVKLRGRIFYEGRSSTVQVDLNDTKQAIDGFGGSLVCWGYAPDSETLRKVTEDLKVTILRTEANTWCGYINRDGTHYDRETYEWPRCRSVLVEAQGYGVDKYLLTFMAPQGFMTGLWEDGVQIGWQWDQTKDVQDLADQMVDRVADFVDCFTGDKPTFYISIQNEPSWTIPPQDNPRYQTCYWPPAIVPDLLEAVGSAIGNEARLTGVTLYVLAPECDDPASLADSPIVPPEDFGDSYLQPLRDLGAYQPDLYAYHMYDTFEINGPNTSFFSGLTQFEQIYSASGEPRGSWETETSGLWHTVGDVEPTPIESAVFAAECIHKALCLANSSAFLWWGLTWHYLVGPTENDKSAGLVLVDIDYDPTDPDARMAEHSPDGTTKKYYAFKHYSYFVEPGYERIAATCDSHLLVSAFKRDDGNRVVVNIVNNDPYDGLAVPVTITGLGEGFTRTVYRTDAQLDCEQLASWDEQVPPMTITTLVYVK